MRYTLCALALAACCAPLSAAEPVTIGYVDMQRVIEESKLGKQAFAALQEKYAEPQAALEKEEKGILQLQQSLARDGALMSQAELDKRKAEFQERVSQIQRKAAMAQQELSQDQAKLGGGIIKPAQEIVTDLVALMEQDAVPRANIFIDSPSGGLSHRGPQRLPAFLTQDGLSPWIASKSSGNSCARSGIILIPQVIPRFPSSSYNHIAPGVHSSSFSPSRK